MGLLILAFVASHNLFIFSLQSGRLDLFERKIWFNSELLCFVIPFLIIGLKNDKTAKEIEMMKIATFIIGFVLALVILNQFAVTPHAVIQMYFFNGITFVYAMYALFFSDTNGNL